MSKENLRPNKVEAPTMFIGVGGTGCKVVKKVFKYCKPEERENIGFVCLDTNVNDLMDITEDNSEITFVQTSNTQTVGSYLDIDKDAAKNWFPKNAVIFDKTVSEGAGQLRAISRLAFNSTIKTGKIAPLCEAIDDLFKKNGQAMKQALRVCVVSTASGGTGSGMILPFCMFVRDYVNNKYPNASVILRTLILLPETLDKVIRSNVEKDSQRRNAYATIKEINAFMMKGSGFCEIEEELKRYRDLHVDITDPGRKELKTLSLLPCDFCFLIDGQDAEDATSNSFEQYQEQAALALYEQNVGPMQKKAFSVEDNIIKELSNPGNYGRNRFGGIGAGRIKYPYEKVVEYIACEWAKNSIGGTGETAKWVKYDNEVALKQKKEKDEGKALDECTPPEQIYIDKLINDGSNNFSKNLIAQYGLREINGRIKTFLTAVENQVKDSVEKNVKLKNARSSVTKFSGGEYYQQDVENWSSADSDYQSMVSYAKVVSENVDRLAGAAIEGILFNGEKNTKILAEGKETYYLEKLLQTETGHFCHPNAARYVLYQLYLTIKDKTTSKKVDENKVKMEAYKGDKEYKFARKVEFNSLDKLASAVKDIDTSKKKKVKEAKPYADTLSEEMSGFLTAIDNYQKEVIKYRIYYALFDYVGKLDKEFERFYKGFTKNVEGIEIRQKNLLDELKYNKGDSVLNVCAGKEVLDELSRSTVVQMNGGQMLDDELNAQIFDDIKGNVKFDIDRMINPEEIGDKKKVDIFESALMEYFKKTVARECDTIINLDIIHAIEAERMLQEKAVLRRRKKDGEDVCLSLTKKEYLAYIKSIIEKGTKISAPGVQRIVGEEAREINVCAYNKSLKDMTDYDMNNILFHGEAVETVSKYEIHFFNALYNLTPDKLKKFAAPKVTDTGVRVAGLYHNAYTVYTRDIGPDCLKSSKMTTHIDRRWDSIAAMPELDIGYQQSQFLRTHKAFVYGLVFQRIKRMRYLDDSSQIEKAAWAYRYVNTHNRIEDMVVTNGTICDEFYEILDSLYIDRALVEDIFDYESKETVWDLTKHSNYEKSRFRDNVEKFVIQIADNDPGKDGKLSYRATRIASLFEIPLEYYESIPSYKRDESELNSIVDAIIDVFRKQIGKYESSKNAKFILCNVLKEQYDRLIKNYDEDYKNGKVVEKKENKVLEVIERKVQEVFESSPQPESYEDAITEMKQGLMV